MSLDAVHRRLFSLAALSAACGLLWHADSQLKWIDGAGFHLQPGFWPVLALAGMAVFAAPGLFRKRSSPASAPPAPTPWRRLLREWFGPAEYAAYFLVYVYLVPRLGYLPATLLGFALLTLRAGYRGWRMVAYSQVAGISIVLLFKSGLQVKIPGGKIYAWFPDALRNFLIANF